jgi:plasmid replication initiation protein
MTKLLRSGFRTFEYLHVSFLKESVTISKELAEILKSYSLIGLFDFSQCCNFTYYSTIVPDYILTFDMAAPESMVIVLR